MAKSSPSSDRPGAAARRLLTPHWETVSIYNGPIVFLRAFEKLPLPVRDLFAVWYCDREVLNGGFDQFFSNSTGVLAPEALAGFLAVGLRECADVVKTAISRFGEPYPRNRKSRAAVLRAMHLAGENRMRRKPFSELDDRYVAAWKREGFYAKLDDFARRQAGD